MKVEEVNAMYMPKPRDVVLTHYGMFIHPDYGVCRQVIFRAIGNDNGVAANLTKVSLKNNEPNVGLWPGDIIQYLRLDGVVLEEIRG